MNRCRVTSWVVGILKSVFMASWLCYLMTMFFCKRNSSSVNIHVPSPLSCWRWLGCSRFFIWISTILQVDDVFGGVFAMAHAFESDSFRSCRWTEPVIRGILGGWSRSSWVFATNMWVQSLSCDPGYSLPCLFFSCWNILKFFLSFTSFAFMSCHHLFIIFLKHSTIAPLFYTWFPNRT